MCGASSYRNSRLVHSDACVCMCVCMCVCVCVCACVRVCPSDVCPCGRVRCIIYANIPATPPAAHSHVRDVKKLGMQVLPLTVLFNLEVSPHCMLVCMVQIACRLE